MSSLLCKVSSAVCNLLTRADYGIWSSLPFLQSEIVIAESRWLGAVPVNVAPTKGIRISCNSNTGVTIVFNLTKGAALTPVLFSNITWNYVAGTKTLLIPTTSIVASMLTTGILPGEQVNLNIVSVTGAYGSEMRGLQIDFIGKTIIV